MLPPFQPPPPDAMFGTESPWSWNSVALIAPEGPLLRSDAR